MPKIITNIFGKLSEKDKDEIKNAANIFGELGIAEYIQKGLGLEEVVKLIFSDFNLKNIVRDAMLWESFKSLIAHIFKIVSGKIEKQTEIQIWIQDTKNPAGLNAAFSLKNEQNIQDLLTTLRTKLENDIFSKNREQEKGKIFLAAFDKEEQVWLIKIL